MVTQMTKVQLRKPKFYNKKGALFEDEFCQPSFFRPLSYYRLVIRFLTHWGRATHICVGNLTIIGSDNGLSPGRRQAIIWTNAGILLIRPFGTNFNEMLIEILTFSFMEMRLKVSSAKWHPFCLGLNVLMDGFASGVFFLKFENLQ